MRFVALIAGRSIRQRVVANDWDGGLKRVAAHLNTARPAREAARSCSTVLNGIRARTTSPSSRRLLCVLNLTTVRHDEEVCQG